MSQDSDNPYVGPQPFSSSAKDQKLFFGREREARNLLSMVISERLVLFYAQSGAGKSSLLNARLVPQLRQEGFVVLPMGRVSGELPEGVSSVKNIYVFNLLLSLVQGTRDLQTFAVFDDLPLTRFLANLATDDGVSYYYDPSEEGAEADASAAPVPPHVLIIDQFEEILTTHPDRWQERPRFFHQLKQAMDDDPLLWVVLTLREDYVAALDPFAPLLVDKLRARVYMQRMKVDSALQAIKQPAEAFGRPFAPNVAERLADDLRQIRVRGEDTTRLGQYVEPVQLQVVCWQLWEKVKGSPASEISEADLKAAGNVDLALSAFYDQAIGKVAAAGSVSERELRAWFDEKLITEGRTRASVYQGDQETAGLSNEAVRLLTDQHIIRSEERAGAKWFELVHDRFVTPIKESNAQWHLHRAEQNPLLRAAQAWQQGSGVLYQGEPLRLALAAVAAQQDVETIVRDFLAASEEAEQRRELEAAKQEAEAKERSARRFKRLVVLLGVMALLASVAGVFAWSERGRAQEALATATSAQGEAVQNEARAQMERAKAEAQKADAESARAQAEAAREQVKQQQRISQALTLASRASENLSYNRTLGFLLAHQAAQPLLDAGDPIPSEVETILLQAGAASSADLMVFHGASINDVAWSPDDTRFVTAGGDGVAQIWDAVTGQQRLSLSTNSYYQTYLAVAWSPDGRRIATGSYDGMVTVWDAVTGDSLFTLSGHSGGVSQVAWSPNGDRLATASPDGTARVWEATTGEALLTFEGQGSAIQSLAWHPDGRQIGTVSQEKALVWDATTGDIVHTLGDLTGYTTIAVATDGSSWVTGSQDGTVRFWAAASGEASMTFSAPTELNHLALSPDGTLLASASGTIVRLWRVLPSERTAQLVSVLPDFQYSVLQLAFSHDGTRLVVSSTDNWAQLWNVPSLSRLFIPLLDGPVRSLAISPDGNNLVAVSDPSTVRGWRLDSGVEATVIPAGADDKVSQVAVDDEGHVITVYRGDSGAKIWEWDGTTDPTLSIAYLLPSLSGEVEALYLNPSGSHLAVADKGGKVTLWERGTGKLLQSFEAPEIGRWDRVPPSATPLPIGTPGAKPTGTPNAQGSAEADSGTSGVEATGTRSPLLLAVGGAGEWLAVLGVDNKIRLIRVATKAEEAVFTVSGPVQAMAFNRQGTRLAIVFRDENGITTIGFWKMDALDEDSSHFPLPAGLTVTSLAIDGSGSAIAVGDESGMVRFYTLDISTLATRACRFANRNLTNDEWLTNGGERAIPDPQVCKAFPLHPTVIQGWVQAGKVEYARKILQAMAEQFPDLDVDPDRDISQAWLELGKQEIGRGDYAGALDHLKEVATPGEHAADMAGLYGQICGSDSPFMAPDTVPTACARAVELSARAADALVSFSVCESAAGANHLSQVLPACDTAVALALASGDVTLTSDICRRGHTAGIGERVAGVCEAAIDLATASEEVAIAYDVCVLALQTPLVDSVMEQICTHTVELAVAGDNLSMNQALCVLAGEGTSAQLFAPACEHVSALLLAHARPVEVGRAMTSTVKDSEGEMWRFAGAARQYVTIQMSENNSGMDTYLELLDGAGTILSQNDDVDGTRNSRIEFLLPSTADIATYLVRARGYNGQTGAYTLRVTLKDTTLLSSGETITGTTSFQQVILFEGLMGQAVTISMEDAGSENGVIDPKFLFRFPSGTTMANDEMERTIDGDSTIVLLEDGLYAIIPASDSIDGEYRLTLTIDPGPFPLGLLADPKLF